MIPRKPVRPWTLSGVALLLVLVACPALAHRVNVFAYVEGGDVVVECSYSRSQRVRHGEVEVANAATGALYLTGKTDEQGAFRFPVPPAARAAKADLRIVLKAGEGHQNDTMIKAEEYLTASPDAPGVAGVAITSATAAPASAVLDATLASKPTSQPAPIKPAGAAMPEPRKSPPVAPTDAWPSPSVTAVDPAVLEAVVERAVEKKIAPLRAMLVAEKEKGPGLTEIIGGIGWLVGLAGIAAYAGSRRGRPGA